MTSSVECEAVHFTVRVFIMGKPMEDVVASKFEKDVVLVLTSFFQMHFHGISKKVCWIGGEGVACGWGGVQRKTIL